MTTQADLTRSEAARAPHQLGRLQQFPEVDRRRGEQWTNVGTRERAVSLAGGAILAALGLARRSLPGLFVAGIGGVLLHRGSTGHSYTYSALHLSTTKPQWSGRRRRREPSGHVRLDEAMLINKPAEELYRFWRNFENLPRFMTHLESVGVLDDRRSHWVAKAPRLAGGSVEWDAEITADEPNRRIAWRSLPGSQVETSGEVRFEKALGDRGTEVHVSMSYAPPAGRLGHMLASVVGDNPRRMIREDLHNFQHLMEIGEILTIIGQPHGTCTGQGKRYTESEWRPLFM
jgi:uncharacterized membrane protein